MEKKCRINLYCMFIILLLVYNCECKRGYNTGRHGGHTTPRNRYTTHSSNNYYQTTQSSIGFEHYQRPQSSGNIGFENVQNRPPLNNQPHYTPVSNNNPSAPQLPQSNHYNPQQSPPGIGFENVQNRIPPNTPTYHQNNYNPYQNHQQSHFPNYNNYGQQHQYPHNGYQPPPNYYNPHYNSPGGVPPPIYQPVQQSSGGSLLGYAGTFAGGYLIGKLTSSGFSGGGGGGGGDREYTVHHYHHNANEVPKQVSVNSNGLMTCSQNETQGLCVPNTFAMCLSNGTIMCVTHSTYTTPCSTNNSMPCVVTVLPCASNDTSCNNSSDANVKTTAVYVPCISKVTVAQQTILNFTSDNSSSNQSANITTTDYCITAIAEPKRLSSMVPSYFALLKEIATSMYQMAMNTTNTTNNNPNEGQNKTEVTTLFPVAANESKTEITTLP